MHDFDLCKLDDLDVKAYTQNDVKSQNMEYLCKYEVYRVEILHGRSTARPIHCNSGHDITIEHNGYQTSALP